MKPYSYREREVIEGGGVYAFYPFDSPLDEYCKGIFNIKKNLNLTVNLSLFIDNVAT